MLYWQYLQEYIDIVLLLNLGMKDYISISLVAR